MNNPWTDTVDGYSRKDGLQVILHSDRGYYEVVPKWGIENHPTNIILWADEYGGKRRLLGHVDYIYPMQSITRLELLLT